jgi:hypothetical protein
MCINVSYYLHTEVQKMVSKPIRLSSNVAIPIQFTKPGPPTRARARTHAHARTHIHTQTRTYTQTHTHTNKHTNTHTNTNKHTHTHKQTNTQTNKISSIWICLNNHASIYNGKIADSRIYRVCSNYRVLHRQGSWCVVLLT